MINEEEERLMQPPNASQRSEEEQLSTQASRIKNVRIAKQLQFLKNYNYVVGVNSKEETIITFREFFEEKLPESSISHTLTIFLPANYPFAEPQFEVDNKMGEHNLGDQIPRREKGLSESNHYISQLLEDWTPRYKILEMIELIKRRLIQKIELEKKLEGNALYGLVKNVNNLKKEIRYVWVIFLLAIIVRILVGFGGYSGKNDWPTLGDFQAHRNWMSITLNKPFREWYYEEMEEPWWRIDYPPVAAYLSYVFALIYRKIEPEALIIQEGYESSSLTSYMRVTSLIVDFIYMIPANILLYQKLASSSSVKFNNLGIFLLGLFLLLMKPDQILIDHGHFQYNSITMGCILYAFYFMLDKKYYLCCIFYTMAVNCKQMGIYFALAFLAALIGLNFSSNSHLNKKNRKTSIMIELGIYAALVVGTTLVIWLPWLRSFDDFKSVLSALFPIHRGLYQLKVANFWCISDVFFKWQALFSKGFLMFLCLSASVFFSLPAFLALIVRPSKKIILLSFSAISMTFYMFSYHGHEKSILLPLIMAPFVSAYIGPALVTDVIVGGCVGIYHLLVEDGQTLSYYVLMLLYIVFRLSFEECESAVEDVYKIVGFSQNRVQKMNQAMYHPLFRFLYCTVILIGIHIAKHLIPAPQSLPYIYNLLFALYSFFLNGYYLIILNLIIYEEVNQFVKTKLKKKS